MVQKLIFLFCLLKFQVSPKHELGLLTGWVVETDSRVWGQEKISITSTISEAAAENSWNLWSHQVYNLAAAKCEAKRRPASSTISWAAAENSWNLWSHQVYNLAAAKSARHSPISILLSLHNKSFRWKHGCSAKDYISLLPLQPGWSCDWILAGEV